MNLALLKSFNRTSKALHPERHHSGYLCRLRILVFFFSYINLAFLHRVDFRRAYFLHPALHTSDARVLHLAKSSCFPACDNIEKYAKLTEPNFTSLIYSHSNKKIFHFQVARNCIQYRLKSKNVNLYNVNSRENTWYILLS